MSGRAWSPHTYSLTCYRLSTVSRGLVGAFYDSLEIHTGKLGVTTRLLDYLCGYLPELGIIWWSPVCRFISSEVSRLISTRSCFNQGGHPPQRICMLGNGLPRLIWSFPIRCLLGMAPGDLSGSDTVVC